MTWSTRVHARITCWTAVAAFGAGVLLPVVTLYFEEVQTFSGFATDPPRFPEGFGLFLILSTMGALPWLAALLIGIACDRWILSKSAMPLRRTALICVNTLVAAQDLQLVIVTAAPELAFHATFGSVESYTRPFRTVGTIILSSNWISALSIFFFIVLCLVGVVGRLRRTT